MSAEILVALIPYIISAGLSFAIAAYVWLRRKVAGAGFFAAAVFCRALLTTGDLLEQLSPTLAGKILWDDLQFYPSIVGPIFLLAFVIRYANYNVRFPRLLWGGLATIAGLFSLAVLTNSTYHLLRSDATLIPSEPFGTLDYQFTSGFLLYVAYILILYIVCLGLLIARWLRLSAPFRGQFGTVILGNSIPLIGATLTLFGVIPVVERDTTAYWFAVSNVIVWWGLYQYRLFDLAPIARDKLIQQMNDIVIVVDAENRVVDMNRAAEIARGVPAKDLIGKSATEAFPAQLELIARFTRSGEVDAEIHPAGPKASMTYHLTATPLMGRGNKLIGRLIVAHDITQLKDAQAALDIERAKLEKTVARRTAALTKANRKLKKEAAEREEIARDLKDHDERLKRLTDATFEGIAISHRGEYVEVNQQLADMLGITQEELIGRKILDFIAPESREEVERRVSLNEEGTYKHIAMRKDSTKFPAEARIRKLHLKDRTLRMTALRDMTEQHFAELSVRLSEERFRLILDNMPILLDAFDENNQIIVWNKACEDATGYTAEEMIGNPHAMEMLYPDPAYREYLWKAAMDPTNNETTFDLTAKNGEKRTIMWFETFRKVSIPGWTSWGLGLDVTETRRAEAAERASRALSDALADTAGALSSNLELDVVLDRVLANVGKSVEHDAADIMLIKDGKAHVVRSMANGMDIKTEGTIYPVKSFPLMAKLVKSNKPLMVQDTHQEPLWKKVPENAWIRSMLAVPVRQKGKVIGIINLLRNSPHAYSEEHARRLMAFADQAAVAIHNAQLYRTERENRELAEALRDSTAALSSKLSQDEVLNSILDNLERVLPHDAANVMLLEGEVARVIGRRGYERSGIDAEVGKMRFSTREYSHLQQMADTLRPVVVTDTSQDPTWDRSRGADWVQSYAGAPIRVGKDVIGFLNVDAAEPGFFDESAGERLTAFADQAAIALRNAQLYRTERENRELAEALRDTNSALSRKLSQEEVLDSILDNLERVLPHTAANIMLVDGDIARVVGKRGYSQWGLDAVLENARRVISQLPNMREMIKTLKPVIIHDTWSYEGWNRAQGFDWIRSHAGAPIIVGKTVIGFLNLDGDRVGFFDESIFERLTAFADQAAIALHNAQLYRTERENRELAEALRDSTAALNSKLSQGEVLNSILDNLDRVLPHDAANVMLVEGDTARIIGKRGYGRWNMDDRLEKARYVISEREHFQQMFTTGKPVIISDTEQAPTWEVTGFVHWIRSYAGAPIRLGDEVIGFLNLDAAEPGFFDESTAERLTAFADQAAIALHNARLYETERRERILAQMFQQLTEGVQGATSPSNILTIVLQALASLVPYRKALIGLLEETGMRVEAQDGFEDHSGLMGKLYLFKENPHLLQILSKGQAALFRPEDMPEVWESLPGVDKGTAIWVAMPLTTWDVTTGLLCLTLADASVGDEDVIASVVTFSQRARLALENSRLLIELLQSKGDLREAQSYLVRSAELAIAGEIATGVAHQISNPLTSVMAHAHLLLQKVQPDSPVYEYGKAIKEATDRAATVVQRMLDFARAREMDMQPVDLNSSLNTAASLVEPQITAHARLILNLEPDLPRVIGSREHLEDVWINLLINARDALKQQTDGVITLTSALDREDDKTIIIQFKDNGPGIALDAQGRIFSSFFTTKEEGVGLGLAICYDIITQHHGSIHVESREGSGANFIVRLPVGAAAGENRGED